MSKRPVIGALEVPVKFPEDTPFWEAANRNELLIKHCNKCDTSHFYPRSHCPLCGNPHTEWKKASGEGVIYSYTIARHAPRPLAPALIQLKEGPTMLASIVEADIFNLQIGETVETWFESAPDGQQVPRFTTRAANQARAYTKAALQLLESDNAHLPTTAPIHKVSVIGAGTMGIGISIALLQSDFSVYLVDNSKQALEQAKDRIYAALDHSVSRGRMTSEESETRKTHLSTGADLANIADSDVVIEAVYENLALKKDLFRKIDQHAKPDAVLGTNTSTLDINKIAAATTRQESVIGLHFFSPTHVMKLLEIVRGNQTSSETVARARLLARRMNKLAVVVGVCFGFVGNRIMLARNRQADRLLLAGASPEQIDRVVREFGLPMGPFELKDLTAGIELGYRRRQETGEVNWLEDQLVALGRVGMKAGKGYYRYEPGKRKPLPDPEVAQLIAEASRRAGLERRPIPDEVVRDLLIYPMINEGIKLVEEGIVTRASDIDLIWQTGYGWPDWKGGPMYYADMLGLDAVFERMKELQDAYGEAYKPAKLLETMARSHAKLTADT